MKYTFTVIISFIVLILYAGATMATPISSSSGGELSLDISDGILDQLYGLENLIRVDDSSDQIWNFGSTSAEATAVAKYAGFDQNFGYISQDTSSGFDASGFVPLFDVSGQLLGSGLNAEIDMVPGNNFVWALYPSGYPQTGYPPWTSLQSQNRDNDFDHMVTWLISGRENGFSGNTIGNYVIAWEDLFDGGDRDYNDLVVEVSGVAPVPEPATMLLFGTGLLGLAGLRLRKKK